MMGADHGAVDHLLRIWNQPDPVQSLPYSFPVPDQCPAPELAVNRRPIAEFFRQVTPGRTRSGDLEYPIQNNSMVRWLASVWASDRQYGALVKRPFCVRHQSRAKLVSIADTSLNHDQPAL